MFGNWCSDLLSYSFPPNKGKSPGIDAIIGQSATRETSGLNPEDQVANYSVPQFVVPKGGEYFFLPSIPTLNSTVFLG